MIQRAVKRGNKESEPNDQYLLSIASLTPLSNLLFASFCLPQVRSLANHCLDLKFSRPIKSVIARRAVEIGNAENMDIEQNAAEALAESCGNDIRQVLNALQMWATKGKAKGNDGSRVSLRYMEFKERAGEIGKGEKEGTGAEGGAKR